MKAICFYLPQYHPIPENNLWWGPGFTEWRNVASARPLFHDHYQPHHPGDLGYYDLRLDETREHQAQLAKDHNIYGFCYYHYWFNGKQLLHRPISDVLATGKPDFPFCLCWANENWTRRWDGQEEDILIKQVYSNTDDEDHIRFLIPYFSDKRYIRIDNKPLFLVYRASRLPNPFLTTLAWRNIARSSGIGELYLVKVESFHSERSRVPALDGFDAALDFQPDWGSLPHKLYPSLFQKLFHRLIYKQHHPFLVNNIYLYSHVVKAMSSRKPVAYPRFPCIVPSWDNSARRRNGSATILHASSPSAYGEWLDNIVLDSTTMSRLPEPVVFINAWNEWAEGNHLEPDLKYGHGYLEETSRILAHSTS